MKLENIELVTKVASKKRAFEHAATCMLEGVHVTFTFKSDVGPSGGGQVHLILDEGTAKALSDIFSVSAREATDTLISLGVNIG